MSDLKNGRIEMIENCLNTLKEVMCLYSPQYPNSLLINQAIQFVNSVKYLEAQSGFDDESLGVRFSDSKPDNKE